MVSEGDRVTKELDDRGRVYIGTALAGREVTVEIVDVEDPGPESQAALVDEVLETVRDAGHNGVDRDQAFEALLDVAEEVDDHGRVEAGDDGGDDAGLWWCQYCETSLRADERPEKCPECDVEGAALDDLGEPLAAE